MTIDLWMLLAAAGLQWLLIMLPATVGILDNGVAWALGNREDAKPPAPWVARARRADANLKENLPLFAILVLAAHVSQTADATTALGAQVFVGSRVAHALLYMAGVAGLRTLAWVVSIGGLGLIVSGIAG